MTASGPGEHYLRTELWVLYRFDPSSQLRGYSRRRQARVSPAPWLKIGRKSCLRNIYEFLVQIYEWS